MKTKSTFKKLASVAFLSLCLISVASAQRPVPGRPPVRPPVAPPVAPVRPPVAPVAPAAVRVTAVSLNVRSGPGPNYPVVFAVQRGAVLTVRAARGGWLNVVGPRGNAGWVSSAYTVRVR